MSEKPRSDQINMRAMEFPTDNIAIGQVRRTQPEIFNNPAGNKKAVASVDVVATMWLEQQLAERAFEAAAGRGDSDSESLVDRATAIQMLDEEYRRYGLSCGLQQTKQLIRAFETAAAGQAKAIRGRNP